MDKIRIRRGSEFWLGALLTLGALGIVGPALFNAGWRAQISEIGAAIAAFAVVGAALIAYDGALAKVRFDAGELTRKREEHRKAFLYRTALACQALYVHCARIEARIKAADMDIITASRRYHADEYALVEPPELREAWNELEILPSTCVREIRQIRSRIMELEQRLIVLQKIDGPGPGSHVDAKSEAVAIRLLVEAIRQSAGVISERITEDVGKIG